jgi:flagellin
MPSTFDTAAGTAPPALPAAANSLAAGDLTINGVDIGAVAFGATGAAHGSAIADAINAKTGETGVTASADAATGALTLSSAKNEAIVVGGLAANEGTTETSTGLTFGSTAVTENIGAEFTGFATEDVTTAENADKMILAMDAALTAVNSSRADLGAIQNRFSSVVTNLQTNSENLSASRSRIMDADYAKETANLSRTQILAQAGTAMLAQANQVPQNVLSLLR